MKVEWNYCGDKDDTRILLLNGKAIHVNGFDEVVS